MLPGGAKSDQHGFARKVLRGKGFKRMQKNGVDVFQLANAMVAASHSTPGRPHQRGTALLQQGHISLGGRVGPHARVHGRGDHHWPVKGQCLRGKHVARRAVRQTEQNVSRCRSHHQRLRVLPRFKVRKNILTR